MKTVEPITWYEREILKLYLDCRSFDEVAQKTGIDKYSLMKTVKDCAGKLLVA